LSATQSRLNVLWLTFGYPCAADPITGVFFRTQAEALVRAGVILTVVAPVPWVPQLPKLLPGRYGRFLAYPQYESEGGVEICRPRYLTMPREMYYGAPHWFIRRAMANLDLKKPDLVHAHFAYPTGLVGQELARAWSVPSVLTLHGDDVHIAPQVNRLSQRRFNRAVVGADEVIAVSDNMAEHTEELTTRKPLTMPIGVNQAKFDGLPPKAKARGSLGLREDSFIVLYAGYLTEAKGIPELLQALGRLTKTAIFGLFVGDGPLLDRVKALSNAMALGPQPNDLVPMIMASADVLVLPSHHEGMPTVLIEAGAARLPVIATAVGGIPELLANDRGDLIPPRSADAILAAIVRARQDSEGANRRAAALKQFVRERYDVDTNAKTLVQLYESLIRIRLKGKMP
jgi:teichuronic acid biosynthesis glycosyltransferase TuaC